MRTLPACCRGSDQTAAAMVEAGEKPMAASWSVEAVMLPASMVLVQAFTMGALLLSKLALNVGMEPFVLLAYRNLIGAIIVAPFAFYLDRAMIRKVNLKVVGLLSVSALFGIVLAMGLHYYGLRATTPAYSVDFLNLIPVVTFAMAVLLRLEKLAARTLAGRMKMAGAAVCVGGTMLASLYKGKLLQPPWPTHLLLRQWHHPAATAPAHHRNMALGTVYLCGSCLAYALWFIVQVRVARAFPCKYLSTAIACVSGTAQALLIGAAVSHGRAASWRLAWDLQLVAVVYSGAFNTGATFCLISWAISRRGPIYPSMFNSLSLVATTVLDSLLLGTVVSVGSLLGSLLIVIGLYAFLWGKGREMAAAAAAAPAADHHHQNNNNKPNAAVTAAAAADERSSQSLLTLNWWTCISICIVKIMNLIKRASPRAGPHLVSAVVVVVGEPACPRVARWVDPSVRSVPTHRTPCGSLTRAIVSWHCQLSCLDATGVAVALAPHTRPSPLHA